MTFGVRYVSERDGAVVFRAISSPYWWRRFAHIYHDGARVVPRWNGVIWERPQTRSMILARGESREYTFPLVNAIESDQITPGRYVMFIDTDGRPWATQALVFEVWEEQDGRDRPQRVGKVVAQGLPPPSGRPSTRAVGE